MKKMLLKIVERAAKTAAQTYLVLLTADGANLINTGTKATVVMIATATVISILTSFITLPFGENKEDPSLV